MPSFHPIQGPPPIFFRYSSEDEAPIREDREPASPPAEAPEPAAEEEKAEEEEKAAVEESAETPVETETIGGTVYVKLGPEEAKEPEQYPQDDTKIQLDTCECKSIPQRETGWCGCQEGKGPIGGAADDEIKVSGVGWRHSLIEGAPLEPNLRVVRPASRRRSERISDAVARPSLTLFRSFA